MNLEDLQSRIRAAADARTALRIRGGGSKDFYGNEPRGEVLDTRGYAGIVSYEPTELVVTARCGTPLAELEQILLKNSQFLPFEPPHFGAAATLGGCIAAGLAGPRRAAAGAVRDFVLGTKLVDGRGQALQFGGAVMKNVAGYDVSRVLAGSLGTLGLIAEASVKVLPRPLSERTMRLEATESEALATMNRWAGQPLPVSATAWHDGGLFVRLSGAEPAVHAAAHRIGGETSPSSIWEEIREQTQAFFSGPEPLWRVSVPSTAAPLGVPGRQLIEWGGALRWVKTTAGADTIRGAARHATLFRASDKTAGAFSPLEPINARLHKALKSAFDPAGIFNPGRMYADL
ncbi:MAG TPA: glycolate oxidase subunit GlcE [Burkholderiales bacterium]|nr:glycolate oxidase subunit GlcE [Burkholderiales bacterium]